MIARLLWTHSVCATGDEEKMTSYARALLIPALMVATAIRSIQAQNVPDRRWHPWAAASVGVGFIKVMSGSDGGGPMGELAAGIESPGGLGAGVRWLRWEQRDLLSNSGGYDARTLIAVATYRVPSLSFLHLTAGLGRSTIDSHDSGFITPNAWTARARIAETGLEIVVPPARAFGLRFVVLREWRLSATGAPQTPQGPSLNQWYLALGLRARP
jgi:hypothetical protein